MSIGVEKLRVKDITSGITTFLDVTASREIFLLSHDIAMGPVKMNYYLMINQCNICVFWRLWNKMNLPCDCVPYVGPQ